MRLNKKILSATVLIVVLSLALNLVSFASNGGTFYTDVYTVYESQTSMLNNLKTNSVDSMPTITISNDLPNDFMSQVWVVFDTGAEANSGYFVTIDFDCYFSGATQAPELIEGNHQASFGGTNYYLGSCIGGDVGSDIHLLTDITSYAYAFDEYSFNGYVTDTAAGGRGTMTVQLEYSTPLRFQYGFYVPNASWIVSAVYTMKIMDPSGAVIDVIKGGVQQVTSGWNDAPLDDSNQQLGDALGELDDMQQNADNDLHDALGDLESPTVDFNGNAVTFITSSVSMLWGSLGGFSAVLLCALFITVFNFISRYRGS